MQRRRLRTAVPRCDADQDVFERRLPAFDEDVGVTVVLEYTRVEKLELRLGAPAAAALRQERGIRIRRLRILVEKLHVRVSRRGIEVEVVLLHVLAMVSLGPGEPEQSLLEDRVTAVPERDGEAQPLVVVADPPEAVLTPSIRARPRVIVRQVVPGRPVATVVFAHGSPLALAEIRPPASPVHGAPRRLVDANLFSEWLCHGVSGRAPPPRARRRAARSWGSSARRPAP